MGTIVDIFLRTSSQEILEITSIDNNQLVQSQSELSIIYKQMQAIYHETTAALNVDRLGVIDTLSSPFLKKIVSSKWKHISDWGMLFHEYNLIRDVLDFLTFQQWQIFKNCNKKIRNNITIRLLQNDNNWNLTMNFLAPYLLRQTRLKQSNADDDYEHSEDIDRTSGYFENYNSQEIIARQNNLDKIITTISFKIKYFQGIMPICACLVQCFNQQISYWLLKYLLHKSQYIQINMDLYQQFLIQLDCEFQELLPDVYNHLENNGFELNYFVMKWIMGLFSEDMPKPMMLILWDLLCHTQVCILIYLIISIFKYLGQQILLSSSDEINQMIKSNLKEKLSSIKFEELIKLTKELYIERRLQVYIKW